MLQTLKKRGRINEYICKVKDMSKALIASGQSISEKELINFIIDEISSYYDPTIVHVTSKLDSLSEAISLTETRFILQ